jgi:leucine dehydrogenase
MTFKAAVAGVKLGGGKGVICSEPGPAPTGKRRREMLLDFADTVNVLEGAYITAEDVGTTSRDMAVIAERSKHVAGLPPSRGGSGDPSPITALGVKAAMHACCERAFGNRDLAGRSVAVVGVGRVGSRLARLVVRAGAKLIVADIDEAKRKVAQSLGARWSDPNVALLADVDVLAPCALGGAINETNVGRLGARVICGSANNQLSHDGLAEDLEARGILYAPDFVANAGGLINIAVEREGYDAAKAKRLAAGIEETMAELFEEAETEQSTPLDAAYRIARKRLAAS